ncbi:MAG: hypothetical protein NT080_11510 [Spirochaetes bacterium]|nr:hypothetical protein [Spirochaetota bacterium]
MFLAINLFSSSVFILIAPLVLARTGQDAAALGIVQTAAAIGAVTGGIAMSVWGGFKRQINGVILGCIGIGLVGGFAFGLGRGIAVWTAASIIGAFFGPVANSSSQTIWQSKVPLGLQGRVFSSRRLISWFTTPIAPLIGGLAADFWAEPLMRSPAPPAFLAWAFGTGPGAGMGMLCAVGGLLTATAAMGARVVSTIYRVETDLPDHDAVTQPEPLPEIAE